LKTTIVLAMHGAPPKDFPRRELGEFFGLSHQLGHSGGQDHAALQDRHRELETMMRAWPRTEANDPYHAAAFRLAEQLRLATADEVVVGFNEFCGPTLDQALDEAAREHPDRIVVVTPMMTRGGGHSEVDIPRSVQAAQERHPGINIRFVWPFEVSEIAAFLAAQVQKHLRGIEEGQ